MTQRPLEHETAAALRAVAQAMKICQSVRATITPEHLEKRDRSPVTVADFGSQAIVCRELGAVFPNDLIVAEEDSAELRQPENLPFLHQIHDEVCRECLEASPDDICRWIDRGCAPHPAAGTVDRFWTLDPIDGTKGYLRGGQYAVALALIVDGQVALGVLGCPNLTLDPDRTETGAMFLAIRGQGAFVTSTVANAPLQRIHVSNIDTPGTARCCESVEAGHSAHDVTANIISSLGITRPPLRLDSQAKYAVVARGEADIYLRLPTREDYREMIWDHAAGVAVIEEAGGTVTDIHGKPLEFTHGRQLLANQGIVATNGKLHDQVLAAVKQAVAR